MPRLEWDKVGERLYETGVDQGVLYVQDETGAYPEGVAWIGLRSVSESPSGAEPSPLYADNIKYLNLLSTEEFAATIGAYYSPEEFDACDGTATLAKGVTIGQQKRKTFGLCYRTKIGNDIDGDEHGYKIKIIYGALAKPSQKEYQTVNNDPSAIELAWEVSTTPVKVTGMKPTATLEIDSTKIDAEKLKALEDVLYGTGENKARLPLPDEIKTLVGVAA